MGSVFGFSKTPFKWWRNKYRLGKMPSNYIKKKTRSMSLRNKNVIPRKFVSSPWSTVLLVDFLVLRNWALQEICRSKRVWFAFALLTSSPFPKIIVIFGCVENYPAHIDDLMPAITISGNFACFSMILDAMHYEYYNMKCSDRDCGGKLRRS